MQELPPNTPVIVGVGFAQQRTDDPRECPEPCELMIQAVRGAADDAGAPALLPRIESISIPQGLWRYRDPARLVARAVGCTQAKTIVSDLGVLQITVLGDLCRRIAAGEQSVGVIAGGEAKYRELCATRAGVQVGETEQADDVAPDVRLTSSDPFCSDLESQRGFSSAVEFFAIIESALRFEEGLGVAAHRGAIAELYSGFSRIAEANPHAWRREKVSAEEIGDSTGKNAMQAFPYAKLHCSQWNVNQAVAVLVCSARVARELGLNDQRWIYPIAQVESHHVVVLAQQRRLHTHPGTVLAGRRAFELTGLTRDDVTAAELYSCFPAAVRSFARDLDLVGVCDYSVTGAMPFAGGPFNHAALEGVARMVEVLREQAAAGGDRPHVGLVANLSGIFGKQGCALFSTRPSARGYAFDDVTGAVAEQDAPVPLDPQYTGPATIVGYTVVHSRGIPSHAIAICDTPEGKRTVVRSDDASLLAVMTEDEFCGRPVQVAADGSFTMTRLDS